MKFKYFTLNIKGLKKEEKTGKWCNDNHSHAKCKKKLIKVVANRHNSEVNGN